MMHSAMNDVQSTTYVLRFFNVIGHSSFGKNRMYSITLVRP